MGKTNKNPCYKLTTLRSAMARRFPWIVVCLVVFGIQGSAGTPMFAEKTMRPFHWAGTLSRPAVFAGDTLLARLSCAIDSGYYVYEKITRITVLPNNNISTENARFSSHVNMRDEVTGQREDVFVDSFSALVLLRVHAGVRDSVRLVFACSYQGCTKNMCLMPATDTVNLVVPVHALVKAAAGRSAGNTGWFRPGRGKGNIIALLFAFLGGLLTCLTPCVYPLIPITVGIFGAQANRGRLRSFLLSLVYVAGIAVMFTSLGYGAAATGSVFGQFLSSPYVAGLVTLVFCLFGISLFGAFDFQLPASLQSRLVSTGGSGFFRSFLMGLVAGIIAAPCTGPSLGAILTFVATEGNPAFGALMLLLFSLGLGLPFMALGTFSSLILARPKPGPWMESVKSFLGILMFAMAFYFLRNAVPSLAALFTRTPVFIGCMAVLVVFGITLGGIHLSFHQAPMRTRVKKILGILLMLAGTFGLMGSVLTEKQYKAEEKNNAIAWIYDVPQGLAQAQAQKKPAMIDFYATWCAACKELSRYTFSDSLVRTRLKDFVCIKADFTAQTPEVERLTREYAIRGLPTIEFISPQGERLSGKRIIGFVNAKEFLANIQDIGKRE